MLLVLTALPEEAQPVLDSQGEEAHRAEIGGVYHLSEAIVAVTGPLEHTMASNAARIILGQPAGQPFTHVINFGAVGAYPGSRAVAGGVYLVGSVGKWDQRFPVAGYEQFLRQFELHVPTECQAGATCPEPVDCLTGATFSSEEVRQSEHYAAPEGFPAGDVEDMELYALASLCEQLVLPLSSIKFVTNLTDDSAVADFSSELPHMAECAVPLLRQVIQTLSAASP